MNKHTSLDKVLYRSSCWESVEMNSTSIHEDVGLIPALT